MVILNSLPFLSSTPMAQRWISLCFNKTFLMCLFSLFSAIAFMQKYVAPERYLEMWSVLRVLDSKHSGDHKVKRWRNKLNGQMLLNCFFWRIGSVALNELGPPLALPKMRFTSVSSLYRKISLQKWYMSICFHATQVRLGQGFLADWMEGWDLTFQKSFVWAGLTVLKKCSWEGTSVWVCHSAYSKISIKERVL